MMDRRLNSEIAHRWSVLRNHPQDIATPDICTGAQVGEHLVG